MDVVLAEELKDQNVHHWIILYFVCSVLLLLLADTVCISGCAFVPISAEAAASLFPCFSKTFMLFCEGKLYCIGFMVKVTSDKGR